MEFQNASFKFLTQNSKTGILNSLNLGLEIDLESPKYLKLDSRDFREI